MAAIWRLDIEYSIKVIVRDHRWLRQLFGLMRVVTLFTYTAAGLLARKTVLLEFDLGQECFLGISIPFGPKLLIRLLSFRVRRFQFFSAGFRVALP